jgi:SAM-dependent methyltransferase
MIRSGMQSSPLTLETRGHLELLTLEDGLLRIHGWAAPFGPRPIDGCVVRAGSRELTGLEVLSGGASSDVQEAHPHLAGTERCRFLIRIRLTPEEEAIVARSVVSVTPTIGDRSGRILFGAVASAIAAPPPENLALVGGGLINGFEFLAHFVERAGLRPDERVLDVGCGVGRMALPLTLHLSERGSYDGFDIVRSGIGWAQQAIEQRFPNFRFRHVDVHNGMYNPGGTLAPDAFRFPYDPASFDFVFLTSVFTHMRGPEVRHYLDEVRRVLRPGGRVLATFFLLDAEARELIAAGRSSQDPRHPAGEGFATDPQVPERVIAFETEHVLRWVTERGLEVGSVLAGSWCGRPRYVSYQDMLILRG